MGVPAHVAAIRKEIARFFQTKAEEGYTIGSYFGVYVFFDYDEEPIYVGQTLESLNQRVGRPLTNRRADAVAMNVLDPFEVALIEVFPAFSQVSEPTKSGRHAEEPECVRVHRLPEGSRRVGSWGCTERKGLDSA